MSEYVDPNPNDGQFEIALRLMGNEVFAISISADPLNKRWVAGALLITIVTVVMLVMFSEPLGNITQTWFNTEQVEQVQ